MYDVLKMLLGKDLVDLEGKQWMVIHINTETDNIKAIFYIKDLNGSEQRIQRYVDLENNKTITEALKTNDIENVKRLCVLNGLKPFNDKFVILDRKK